MPRPQQQTAVTVNLLSPNKGLNTVDRSLAGMDPADALSIQNFICTPQGLSVRQGYRKWATGLPAAVTSFLPYNARNSSNSKLFVTSGSAIYDVTTGGTVGAPVVSGLSATNVYWQSTAQSFSTASTNFLVCVNGADSPRLYDGSTWTTCSQVASPSGPGQFKNVDSNGNAVNIQNFCDVLLHQQRLWFVRNNSSIAYYCDVAATGGNLYPFDFGPLFPSGGRLHKLATWTNDMGGTAGSQAVLVAISDRGDVVLFTGNNPAVSWSMSGQFKIGAPIGRRCTTPFEGDLLILSQDGLYPMSKYQGVDRADTSEALTYKIGPTISSLVSSLKDTPGFEATVYPGQNVMLLNVPQSSQLNNFQFCFQTQTSGWSQFTNWPAQCFGVFNDSLYLGGTNFVALAFIGFKDGADIVGAGGDSIVATAMSAFNSLAAEVGQGTIKKISMAKPYLITGASNPQISIGVNTDFNLTPIVGSATVNVSTGGVWDTAKWDAPETTWVGTLTTASKWTTVYCYPGTYAAVVISVSAAVDTIWSGTDLMVTPGGPYG